MGMQELQCSHGLLGQPCRSQRPDVPHSVQGRYANALRAHLCTVYVMKKKGGKWKKLHTHTTERKAQGHVTALRVAKRNVGVTDSK